jgi:hypothetical protein
MFRLRRSRRPGGRPDGEAVSHPLVEDVATQNEHRAIYRDIVASYEPRGHAQMVGETFLAIKVLRYRSWVLLLNFSRKGTLRRREFSRL